MSYYRRTYITARGVSTTLPLFLSCDVWRLAILHPHLFTAGRILVGVMFLYSAGTKITGFRGMSRLMQAYNFPLVPVALVAAIVWELTGAALLIVGMYLLFAGLGLSLFVLAATAMIHGKDAMLPERRHMAMVHIANNVTLVGGLIAIAAF